MTIKFRLIAAVSALCLTLAALAGVSLFSLSDSARAVSELHHNVLAMEHLKRVADMYAVNMVDTTHKLRGGSLSWPDGKKAIADAKAQIESNWSAFLAGEVSPAEQALIDTFASQKKAADDAVEKLEMIVGGEDMGMIIGFAEGDLYPAIDPVSGTVSSIVDLNIHEAGERVAGTQAKGKILLFATLIIAGIALAAAAFAIFVASSGVVRPIEALQRAMRSLADGNVDLAIPGIDRRDEMGAMASTVEVFRNNALERQRLEGEQAEGRLARERRSAAVEDLVSGFDVEMQDMLKALAAASTELEATASSLSETATNSIENASSAAAASQEAAFNVDTVAQAADQMAESISAISAQVHTALDATNEAMNVSSGAAATANDLIAATEKVGGIVELINKIAEQTNLLALNATIEAARAGEMGKGFAVVASEVKSLASQTSKATEEIARQVSEMQGATGNVVTAIQSLGGLMQRVVDTSSAISAAVEEQSATTTSIASNVNQAATGTKDASASVTNVQEYATQTGVGARDVFTAAEDLAKRAGTLKSRVDDFFTAIRAA